MKKQGKLPPDIDHLWFNLPSGWAEYTEEPAKSGQEAQSHTVTLGTTPTKEQWDEYYPDIQVKIKAWQAEKARQEAVELHGGDPRYDPMTGDLLKPDEHPLSPTSSYFIEGRTRPRRFLPPGSPYLKNAKPLQTDREGDQPESPGKERLVERLRKAGFVEVEPDAWDKRYYAFCERLRNMSSEQTAS